MGDAVASAARVVFPRWDWCARYQQTLYRSVTVPACGSTRGRSDRELLEIAMSTDYITDAHMHDVVTGRRTIADVVEEYIRSARARALRMFADVMQVSATCTSAEELAHRGADSRELATALVTVADIVRHVQGDDKM